MQGTVLQIMGSDNAFEALEPLKNDALKRLPLQASVAALVSLQSGTAIAAEFGYRAGLH